MKLAGLGKLFTMLYDDQLDIYRTDKKSNDDNTVDISYQPTPLYSGIRCRLSFSSDDTGADSEVDRNPVRFNPKLFCETGVDLQAGDYVAIRRYGDDGTLLALYQGQVSQPSKYSTHQEAFVRIDGGA